MMEKAGTAYFVQNPRVLSDLVALHDVAVEEPYEIVKEISLKDIDFENFAHDMTVDRQFIEDNASLCEDGEIKKCLFVHGSKPEYGILVLPEEKCYVGWAAYARNYSEA